MAQYRIEQKRIIKYILPREYDINKIEIGVPVITDEARKVGLYNINDVVLPSASFGSTCKKNAYGYSYPDKSQPKARRWVSTIWIYPFGNTDASQVPVDIYRKCYPKIIVSPINIELTLYLNDDGDQYVVACLTPELREKNIKDVVNLFLEIYGYCFVFQDEIKITKEIKRVRCNWEILPPGENPSAHITKVVHQTGQRKDGFFVARLEQLEKFRPIKIVEGINGFIGYYAYIFKNTCFLECAFYGNATYILPVDNWELLSQKTKQELVEKKEVFEKIIHTEEWFTRINKAFIKYEV